MIKRMEVQVAYQAVNQILQYTRHVLTMDMPPNSIAIPTKMIVELRKGFSWEEDEEAEED